MPHNSNTLSVVQLPLVNAFKCLVECCSVKMMLEKMAFGKNGTEKNGAIGQVGKADTDKNGRREKYEK